MLRVGEPEQLKAAFKDLTDHPEELQLGKTLNTEELLKHLMEILEDIFDILQDVDESQLYFNDGLWDTLYIFNKRFPSVTGNYLNDRMVEWDGPPKRQLHNSEHPLVRSYLEEPYRIRKDFSVKMFELPDRLIEKFSRFRDMLKKTTNSFWKSDDLPKPSDNKEKVWWPKNFRDMLKKTIYSFWKSPKPSDDKEKVLTKWQQILFQLDNQVFGSDRNRWLEIARKIITMMKRGCNTKLEWDAYLLFELLFNKWFIEHRRYLDHDLYIHEEFKESLSAVEIADHSAFDADKYVDAFMKREIPHLRRWVETGDTSILDDIEERIVKTPYMTCLYGHLFQKRAEALWHPGVKLRSGKWVGQGGLVRKRLEEIKEFNAKAEELTKAHKREETI